MKFRFLYIIFFLICVACSSTNKSNQNILVEKPTNIIVNKSDHTPYTGEIIINNEENITFKGKVLNGQRHGKCFWVKENGDTVLLQIYEKGNRVYSNQFDLNGNRSKESIKYQPEITRFDSLLIDSVFQIIENSNYNLLGNIVQQNQLPYADLVKNLISELESEFGDLQEINLKHITKTLYDHRPEKYLELETMINFDSDSIRVGMRLLENENKLQTIEVWRIKLIDNESKSYRELDIWTFLNI